MTRPYKALTGLLLTGILATALAVSGEAKGKRVSKQRSVIAKQSAAVTKTQSAKPAYAPARVA